MEPLDKFGNQIYPKTYNKMLGYARVLKAHGYTESLKKANLFYRKGAEGVFVIFFADMRGTDSVPIWEDPSPLLYAQFSDGMPGWKQRRLLEREYLELRTGRLSFNEGGNGYCVVCGKDFQDEGLFCSKQCEEAYHDFWKIRCKVCGKELTWDQAVEHHLSYKEDKTITVCRSCHLKIHRGSKLQKLKPEDIPQKARRGGQS